MHRVLVAALALAGVGCSYHVWSPPARAVPLEDVGALGGGEVRVGASASGHLPFDVFDDRPSPIGGALDLGVGLGENVDLRATGQALHLAAGGQSDLDRNIWSGRGGVRWAPEPWIAFGGGVGAGAHAAGAFVAPDVGVTLGYQGPIAGFFIDLRAGASVPVDPRTIELTLPTDDERHFATPAPTALVQMTGGFRLAPPTREEAGVDIVLRVAPSMTLLIDEEQTSFWFGAALGLEVAFGAPPPEAPEEPPPADIRPAPASATPHDSVLFP